MIGRGRDREGDEEEDEEEFEDRGEDEEEEEPFSLFDADLCHNHPDADYLDKTLGKVSRYYKLAPRFQYQKENLSRRNNRPLHNGMLALADQKLIEVNIGGRQFLTKVDPLKRFPR